MNDAERNHLIVSLIDKRAVLKRHVECYREKLDRYGQTLRQVAGAMGSLHIVNTAEDGATGKRMLRLDSPNGPVPVRTLPAVSDIAETLDELRRAEEDLQGVEHRLRNMGVAISN